MSDFRARIFAELDTSRIEKGLKSIENNKILLKNVSISTAGLSKKIQEALSGHQFTLNLSNVKIDNLSKTITGQMRSAGQRAGQDFSEGMVEKIYGKISSGSIEASIARVDQKFAALSSTINHIKADSIGDKLHEKMQTVQVDLEELHSLQEKFMSDGLTGNELVDTYEAYRLKLAQVNNNLSVVSSSAKQFASAIEVAALQNRMEEWLTDNTRATNIYGNTVQGYIAKLKALSAQGDVTKADLNELASSFARVDEAATSAGLKGKSFGSVLSRAFKNITRYISVATLFYSAFNAMRQGVRDIVDLDAALVDLQKTTDATETQLKQFYFTSNDIAKQLGASTKEVIQAAADWSRLGYSIKDAETMAKVSSIFASISPGMDIEKATDGLVSAMKANIHALLYSDMQLVYI